MALLRGGGGSPWRRRRRRWVGWRKGVGGLRTGHCARVTTALNLLNLYDFDVEPCH